MTTQLVAIATDAAKNITRSTSSALADLGFDLVVHSGSNKVDTEETAKLIRDNGCIAEVVLSDFSVPGDIYTACGASAGVRPDHPAPPVGRMETPEEVAAVIALLCRPRCAYLTGQIYHVNGGEYFP